MDEKRHRKNFSRFAQEQSAPEFQETLGRLNALWCEWNHKYFGGQMVVPYIVFTEPRFANALGSYSPVTSFGGKAEVKIRPSLIWGGHPMVRKGEQFAQGRFKFAADVLLHEMIHQWQHEVAGNLEITQAGHGPLFRDKCNEIGAVLRLRRVRTGKSRGSDRALPSCSHWPHNVRPKAYYSGAIIPKEGLTPLGLLTRAAREYANAPENKILISNLLTAARVFGTSRG